MDTTKFGSVRSNTFAPHCLPAPNDEMLHKSVVSVANNSMEPPWWGDQLHTAASHLVNVNCGRYLQWNRSLKTWFFFHGQVKVWPSQGKYSSEWKRRKEMLTCRKERKRELSSQTFCTTKAKEHHPGPKVPVSCPRKAPSKSFKMIV